MTRLEAFRTELLATGCLDSRTIDHLEKIIRELATSTLHTRYSFSFLKKPPGETNSYTLERSEANQFLAQNTAEEPKETFEKFIKNISYLNGLVFLHYTKHPNPAPNPEPYTTLAISLPAVWISTGDPLTQVDIQELIGNCKTVSSLLRVVSILHNSSKSFQLNQNTSYTPDALRNHCTNLFADYMPLMGAKTVQVQITHAVNYKDPGSGSLHPIQVTLRLRQKPS